MPTRNSRPRPWQGRALPTELFPQWRPLGDSNPCYRRERAVSCINQGGLGLVSANYDLSYQGNNLTITKALLNVIADAKTKVRLFALRHGQREVPIAP